MQQNHGARPPEVQLPPTTPIPRDYIPPRSSKLNAEHAGRVLSAQNPGAPQSTAVIQAKLREIGVARDDALSFANSSYKLVLEQSARCVGVLKKDGTLVGSYKQLREAFGSKKYPIISIDDLMMQQKDVFCEVRNSRDDVRMQMEYMDRNGYRFMTNEHDDGSNEHGGCFTKLFNQEKNDLKDKIRDASFNAFGRKVVLCKPTQKDREWYIVSSLGDDAYLLTKPAFVLSQGLVPLSLPPNRLPLHVIDVNQGGLPDQVDQAHQQLERLQAHIL